MHLLSFRTIYCILAVYMFDYNNNLQVHGQCDDATRPLVLKSTSMPQYFTSPNFPNYYPPNADCAWYIEAPGIHDKIILNLEEFRSQENEFLTIYQGADENGTLLIQVDDTNQKQTNAIVSSGHQLYFTFQSDGANEQSGFNILYFSNNTANQHPCGDTVTLTSSTEQAFLSPNLPNPLSSNDSCHWYFNTTVDSAIVFKIKFLDMNSCRPEFLTFYDGNSTSDTVLAEECSTAYTYTFNDIITTSTEAYVQWIVSDEIGDFYGFMFTVGLNASAGINLTYPLNNETIAFTMPENSLIGNVNESIAVIILTYTGDVIDINIDPRYTQTTEGTVDLSEIQLFAFSGTKPNLYLTLISTLDYETINYFSLLITLVHPDVPDVTYTVTFNITITDVDDEAPTFNNLPNNATLSRATKAGYQFITVNASDADGTEENRQITFSIFSGNTDDIFDIDLVSGNLTLAKDARLIPTRTDQYDLTIVAYSGSKLGNFASFTVYVDPDSPPNCTHGTVWAETLDINVAITGTVITLLDAWRCTDDNINITYSIESLSPNVTTDLFEINNFTGVVSLLRKVLPSEVPDRQFILQIGATDSVGQTEVFNLFINVTALSCLPSPRNLYVRMDLALGGVILSIFNCTSTQGLSYSLKQYPQGTFAVKTYSNDRAELILTASVVKIKFYGLTITITDGLDIAVLKFNVIIQTRRCGLNTGVILHKTFKDILINFVLIVFITQRLCIDVLI